MPNVGFTFAKLRVDGKGYIRTIDRIGKEAVTEAARAFVHAAAEHVPVYSGQARGTLQPLAKFTGDPLSINAPHPRTYKNQFTGEQYSEYDFTFSQGLYHLSFIQDLDYYNLYEPDLWRSFYYGRKAARKVMKQAVASMPSIRKYITKVTDNG